MDIFPYNCDQKTLLTKKIPYDSLMHTLYVSSPIGTLKITADENSITGITSATKKGKSDPDTVTKKCAHELEAYFNGKNTHFSIPMKAAGTPFQKSVWAAMSKIPYGKTKSYAEIARAIKKPKAIRAVGSACGKNPLLITVPCHRVVGSHGGLGGFSAGIKNKKLLLAHEQQALA